MSLIPKLRSALSVVFVLTTAGAISVLAQTQAIPESSSAVASAAATSEPKKVEGSKPSVAPAEKAAPDRNADLTRDATKTIPLSVTKVASNAEPETSNAPTSQPTPDDKWQFQFTPYFWLASLHGTAGIGNRTTQVDESFSDIFDVLKFAFMGTFEARKGKWISLTDLQYVSVSDDKATPGPLFSNVDAKFKTFIFDPEVGYRVFENPDKGASVDIVGGARIWHVSTELDFGAGVLPATTVQGSRNWVDAVGGVRFKAALSEKVFVSGKFDLGGGGSKFTYQVFGGVGYNITPKIALIGGYRVLDVDYNKNNFIYDMNQRGPIVGVGFRF